ncbi:hypothetical protein DVJ77_10045 [Dyella tabacisoli]|uniref:Uncharacterized protein n=1 Tax=Dyella tabacisoli TaxID=2282381 RepID=A0A369UL80_9GAMM|nr:hypothetical protein DVJ77_10045 [Dyella tabacisoli]
MYFLCSFVAAVPVSLGVSSIFFIGTSNFEGGRDTGIALFAVLGFVPLVTVFWLGYLHLRHHPRALRMTTVVFGLLPIAGLLLL